MSLRANWLTLSRVPLAGLFAMLFSVHRLPALWACAVVLALAGLSDVLDGYFARRKGSATRGGELVDSVADGVARFTVLLSFVGSGLVPVWMVLLIFWRDLISWGLRFMDLAEGRYEVHKRLSGKVNGAVQSAAIAVILGLLIARESGTPVASDAFALSLLAGAITSVWSTADLILSSRSTLARFTGLVDKEVEVSADV